MLARARPPALRSNCSQSLAALLERTHLRHHVACRVARPNPNCTESYYVARPQLSAEGGGALANVIIVSSESSISSPTKAIEIALST